MRHNPTLVPGRGVVRETQLEFEVVLPGGQLFFDSQGRFLMTHARALIVARASGGKMWRMEHTPYNSPGSFDPHQLLLFQHGRCPYIVAPAVSGRERYCRGPVGPRADYGHCEEHKNQLLAACLYARYAHVRIRSELVACFRKGMTVLSTIG